MLPRLVHKPTMKAKHHEFLNPQCLAVTLDSYIARRSILLAVPLVSYLSKHDKPPAEFCESSMITGISVTAIKPE